MPSLFRVKQNTPPGPYTEEAQSQGIANRMGMEVISDFYLWAAMTGLAYQVRAGTITTPLVGDVLITDTAAEMAVSAATGYTVIPVSAGIQFRLAAGTLFECAGKSVGSATISGTAFVPLPLKIGGAAAATTAAVSAAGGVTVAAELATTTRRHFEWGHPIAAGAWPATMPEWAPRVPPQLVGPASFYMQIAGTGTGPSYYAHFDYLELVTATVY